jgi:hypothetical protein
MGTDRQALDTAELSKIRPYLDPQDCISEKKKAKEVYYSFSEEPLNIINQLRL